VKLNLYCILLSALLPFSAAAEMVHRYSFNTNADDLVGSAHGTLIGTATISNGALVLDGSNAWLQLPASAIGINKYHSITIEAWFTLNTSSGWNRLFDFGDTYADAGGYYLFYSPSAGGSGSRFCISTTGYPGYQFGEEYADSTLVPAGTKTHIICVYDGINRELRVYRNGYLSSTKTNVTYLLTDVHNAFAFIGKSNYTWDPLLNGSVDEFRIYNIPFNSTMALASYQAGPDAPPSTLSVPSNPNPSNGQNAGILPTLSWSSDPSPSILSHRVYLGTDYRTVLTATTSTTGVYQTTLSASQTSFTPSVPLEKDQIYYWRIEEVTSSGYVFSGPVWSFLAVNPKANNPSPPSGTIGVSPAGITLQWQPGYQAVGHRILLGTSPSALQVLEENYPDTSYWIGPLEAGRDYFWRIDEHTASGPDIEGDVWSFSTSESIPACLPGDLDGNCLVDLNDLLAFAVQWLQSTTCSGYDCADFDSSRFVDLEDFSVLTAGWQETGKPMVVINEIHYHPDSNKEPVEFIELYNAGAQSIDLNGWYLEDAVDYRFDGPYWLAPGDFAVIAANPAAVQQKFGVNALGPWEGKLSNEGERIILRDAQGQKIDEVNYGCCFPWPTAANGEGASMELLNPYLDNDLGGSWRSSGFLAQAGRPEEAFGLPTPGRINSVFTNNAPPQIRQVKHLPNEPKSTDPITITAKITDPDGVASANLKVQIVLPGQYIPAYLPIPIASLLANPHQTQPQNPAFEDPANWQTYPMRDDGTGGDAIAGDSIYTAVVPAQIHRTLVRYRIEATDNTGRSVRTPYADDGSLNFACFVYNGVPPYVASKDTVQPSGPGYTYSSEILTSVPVYHLITRAEDFFQCHGYNSADRIDQGTTNYNNQEAGKVYNWSGTLVYDGQVYDNIGYRLRGGNGRYNYGQGGKRSMKFRFNRGNYFQARDLYGNKFPSRWQHLVTAKMFGNRLQGRYALNEMLDMMLWNQVGVPAPMGWWFHFRVIDGPEEAPNTVNGQYEGDFWGLYLAWEDYDGAFLENHEMPKGNLYKLSDKIYEGLRQQRYQGPEAVDDASDYENIRWNLNANATAQQVLAWLDTDMWIRYHTVVEAVRHYDIFSGPTCFHCLKNAAWYFYPDYTAENQYWGRLWILPYDVDDTWGPFFNQGIDHGAAAVFDQYYVTEGQPVQMTIQPEKAPIKQAYRNYIREFLDLHWKPEIIDGMIDELAYHISELVPADRDRWRLNPLPEGARDDGPLSNIVADLKKFAWQGGSWTGDPWFGDPPWPGTVANLEALAGADGDSTSIPYTPTISYIGTAGYPLNDLRFQTSPFSDPQGSGTFGAIQWRIAEHRLDFTLPSAVSELTLIAPESQWRYFKGTRAPSVGFEEWRQLSFNDEEWLTGQTSIGFADNDDNTVLNDMQGQYSSVYLRKKFEVPNKNLIQSLKLRVRVDDGCIIWINGTEVARLYCSSGDKYYNSLTETTDHEAPAPGTFDEITLSGPYNYLLDGENVIAVHALQVALSSSDFTIDVALTAQTTEPVQTGLASESNRYEIQPTWVSEEITDPANRTIQIPGSVVRAGRTYRVRCRMKDNTGRWGHWSEPIEFVAGPAIGADLLNYLRVSELMYNPAPDPLGRYDKEEFEFLELTNISSNRTLDLSTVSISNGISFSFGSASITTLAPGDYVLVVRNRDAFNLRYPGLSSKVAGQYSGKLNNDGETIDITETWNGTLVSFTYNDGLGWPQAADGGGHSIVPAGWWTMEDQQAGILNYGPNWRQSACIGGSPGAADPEPAASLVINELMAHTDFSSPLYPDYDSNDWIELYNPTSSPIALDGNWYLSDDIADLKKWAIPSLTVPAYSFVSFDEITGFHNPLTSGFGLDKAGETIFLSYLPGTDGTDRVIDCIRFQGQENSVSMGRYPDGSPYWFRMLGTRNAPNAYPLSDIVISELMYHPPDETGAEEYIELFNPTGSTIVLTNSDGPWRLDNAVSFTFPSGLSLTPGAKILIVPFDPSVETGRLEAFESYYGCTLTAGVNVFGPWSGNLSNGGERLALEKPQASDDPLNPAALSWILIDQVNYSDYHPWPAGADGLGYSLTRLYPSNPSKSGDDPTNWTAAPPTPGR
jgi:hypothetical protein